MVKIKTKKEMNLAELIQYIIENDIKNTSFSNQDNEDIMVWSNGKLCIYDHWNGDKNHINPKALFTVEVEEEVTKYSVLPNLVELYDLETGKGPETLIHQNALVNNFIENEAVIALYAMNDDYTLTPLWTREGGMVE